ncbi:T cell receptor alpha variable 21, partial [Galemys pyrenaicus]
VRGDQVQQSPAALSLLEGANTTLSCNFSTSLYAAQWFRQNPGDSLVTLFYLSSGTKHKGRLKATAAALQRHSSLQIFSAETSDSATYFCAMSHSAPQAPAACAQTLMGQPPPQALSCSKALHSTGSAQYSQSHWQGVSGQEKEKKDQQQVKQSPPSLMVQEGEISVLDCTYKKSTFDYFPWYIKYPGKGPTLLIDIRSNNDKEEKGRYILFFHKNNRSSSLHIMTSESGDSATYFCAGRGSSKQEVRQSPAALRVQEGDSSVLNCSFTDNAIYFLQWFRQDPGRGLTSLVVIQSNQREQTNGRLRVLLDKSSKQSALFIAPSQPGNSATYLCAVSTVPDRHLLPAPEPALGSNTMSGHFLQ